jgi:hypothetical protein
MAAKMMKINSDGSVQTVTSSIVFQAFKELNDRQKQSFIKMMLEYISTLEKATRVRQNDTY